MYVYLVIVYDMGGVLSHEVFRTQKEAFEHQRNREQFWRSELNRDLVQIVQIKQFIPF